MLKRRLLKRFPAYPLLLEGYVTHSIDGCLTAAWRRKESMSALVAAPGLPAAGFQKVFQKSLLAFMMMPNALHASLASVNEWSGPAFTK